jgi:hypothetical protein
LVERNISPPSPPENELAEEDVGVASPFWICSVTELILIDSLADVAGTQEPIYGPEAIQPVTKQAENIPYTELTKDDLKWIAPQHTCVETQTFYVMADNGALCFIQVIYSNVM